MKKALIIVFEIICILMIAGCRKSGESDATADAILTGYDIRACACCGGLMVNFNQNPIPYSDVFNLVNDLPDNSGIDSSTKFPLNVRITWKYSNRECGGTKFVDILKLEIK